MAITGCAQFETETVELRCYLNLLFRITNSIVESRHIWVIGDQLTQSFDKHLMLLDLRATCCLNSSLQFDCREHIRMILVGLRVFVQQVVQVPLSLAQCEKEYALDAADVEVELADLEKCLAPRM